MTTVTKNPLVSTNAAYYNLGANTVQCGLSIVTPMYNEVGGAVTLVEEIKTALALLPDIASEIIVIDDGSSDGTGAALLKAKAEGIALRLITHQDNAGQSRAIRTGVIAAKFDIIGMIDGDGQNDPADIPVLYRALRNEEKMITMIAGERQKREDTEAKRYGSRIANFVRQKLLNDAAADSGCGLKVFRRDAYLRLPYFDHIHRYLPFMMQREGYKVSFLPVRHRARTHGTSKYTNMGRLLVAFRDLIGVMWLKARSRSPNEISEQ